jgi:hypothetical protein
MASEPRLPQIAHDVFISYAHADADWARHLSNALTQRGVKWFSDLSLSAGDQWADMLERELSRSRHLVVLWSPATGTSSSVAAEVSAFDALSRYFDGERSILPIALGGTANLDEAPSAVKRSQVILVSDASYKAGPGSEPSDWVAAIEVIARAAKSSEDPNLQEFFGSSGAPSQQPTPRLNFGMYAQLAMTYAADMLEADPEPNQLRSAALLSALFVSASESPVPSTGDVVRHLLAGQPLRNAAPVFARAAQAAGLAPSFERRIPLMGVDELLKSSAAPIALRALDVQQATGASGIHLRHLVAAGLQGDLPSSVLDELGVTMIELVDVWRESLIRTWPTEPIERWDAFIGLPVETPATDGPPSARVHADRWTTDDRLDYALYAKAVAEFIGHPDATPPMVISVQAPWGQGKTSFMRMVQKDLDPEHPDFNRPNAQHARSEMSEASSEVTLGELRGSLDGAIEFSDPRPAPFPTVWFNAWKYQSSEQIWAGLAHAILAQLPARLSRKDRELFWLGLQLRRIDAAAVRQDIHRATLEQFLPRLVSAVVVAFGALVVLGLSLLVGGVKIPGITLVGTSLVGAVLFAYRAWGRSTKEALSRRLEGAYLRYVRQPDYASKLGYLHLVEEDMGAALDLLTPSDRPAVVFIDDLDRCSPEKISEVIEAVNLFLAGEYPNCAFVIGIDAEVVAASMEVVHASIIERLADRRGELGWRFLDKFVQLPFVLPRLQSYQRETFLRGLFSSIEAEQPGDALAEADRLELELENETLSVDEMTERVADLTPRLAEVAPDRARALGEQAVSVGAQAFSDDAPEVAEALARQISYLSDNPRTIKRAVNLYRFHRFTAFARRVSPLPLEVATPEQIGRWVVVIVRWPQFVRWLQAQRESASGELDQTSQLLKLAEKGGSPRDLRAALPGALIVAPWTEETELLEFLLEKCPFDLRLDLASARGLW